MARFGRMFALGSGDGKTVPTKTSPSSLQKLWRTLSAGKKRVPLRFFTYPVKSTRVLFKEIELWERCKTTVICGMKSMTNTANVENAGLINNPPGCFSTFLGLYKLTLFSVMEELLYSLTCVVILLCWVSDFRVQTSMSQRWKLLDQEKSVASRACWKLLEKKIV